MLLIGKYETKSSVIALQLATRELNHRDEAVDIGGLKLGGDHASIPKLVEPLGRHLVHTDRARRGQRSGWRVALTSMAATLSMLGVSITRSTP